MKVSFSKRIVTGKTGYEVVLEGSLNKNVPIFASRHHYDREDFKEPVSEADQNELIKTIQEAILRDLDSVIIE